MAINILMPALSPTMEQGKLAKWLKNEGDAIKAGDPIAEIETDKATMEVEAVDEGTLSKILIAAGTDNVAVNTPIAVLVGEGEDTDNADREPAGSQEKKTGKAEASQETRGSKADAAETKSGNSADAPERPSSYKPVAPESRPPTSRRCPQARRRSA